MKADRNYSTNLSTNQHSSSYITPTKLMFKNSPLVSNSGKRHNFDLSSHEDRQTFKTQDLPNKKHKFVLENNQHQQCSILSPNADSRQPL